MIPATAFYLLRHGESEANLQGVAAGGGVDTPLTAKGESQAYALADLIDQLEIKPSVIFSSPMKRARRTAEIVNMHLKLPMTIVEGLEEHHIGEWEGKPWSEIGPRFKNEETPPGGENYQQYWSRVQKNLTPVLSHHHETPPLIVAHGGTFYAIAALHGWKIDKIDNCHLHRFAPCPEHAKFPWQIWEYNIAGVNLRESRSSYCPLFPK